MNRRAIESDLLIYVNINLVPMDGGHKSVAVGLCDYESCVPPRTADDSRFDIRIWTRRLGAESQGDRLGKLVDEHCKVFHIETALNNKMFPPATTS